MEDQNTGFKVHNTDFEVHNTDFEVHNTDFEVHNTDFEVHNTDFEVHNTDFEVHNTDFEVHNTDFEYHNADFKDHNAAFEDHNAGFEVHNEDLNTETVPWRRKNISLPKNNFETSLENVKTTLNALKVKEDSTVKFDEISKCLRTTQSDDKNSISRLHLAVDKARVRIECKISDWASSVQDGQAMFECDLRLDAILAATGHGLNKDASKLDAYNKAVKKLTSQHIPVIEFGLKGLELHASKTPFPYVDEKDNPIAIMKSVSEEDKEDGNEDIKNPQGRKQNYRQCSLADFIIMVVKHNKSHNSLTVLKQSAHFCNMSLEFEVNELRSGVRCRVYLEGQFVEEHIAATKRSAKTRASEKALEKLYGICWTIVEKPGVDSHFRTVTPEELIGDTVKFDKPIPSNNIGNILLQKMGWIGGGLGKEGNKGITEPVSIGSTVTDRQGFGLRAESGIKADFRPKVRSILMDYARFPDETDLVFSSQFSKKEQHIIIGKALKLGLKYYCWNVGKGKRQTVISRRWTASQLLHHVKCRGGSTPRFDLLPPGTKSESLVFTQTDPIAELISTPSVIDGEVLGLIPGPVSKNDLRTKVRTFLMNYIASSDQNDLVFSPQFSMKERNIISRESRKFGLDCKGKGCGENRVTIVSRKRKITPPVSAVTCSLVPSAAKHDLLPSAAGLHQTGGPGIPQPMEAGDGDSQGNELLQEMDWTGGGVGKEGKKGPTKGMWGTGMIDHEGLGLMPRKFNKGGVKRRVRTLLLDYARSSNQNDLFFSPQFNERERAIIRRECQRHGLKWIGQGKGYNRFMIVSRKQEINHDLLASAAGSASSVFIQSAGTCNSQPTQAGDGDSQGNGHLQKIGFEGVGNEGNNDESCEGVGNGGNKDESCEGVGNEGNKGVSCEGVRNGGNKGESCEGVGNGGNKGESCEGVGNGGNKGESCEGVGNGGNKGVRKPMTLICVNNPEELAKIAKQVSNVEFTQKIKTLLINYTTHSDQNTLSFSPKVNKKERKIIHSKCQKLDLKHISKSSGDKRSVTVYRKQNAKS